MDTLFKLSDFFKGRDPFKHLKGPLSLLFVSNITYLLYCYSYPGAPNLKPATPISWVAYFLHGEYVVPLGLFVLTWVFTLYLGRAVFQLPNWLLTERARTWILQQSILQAFDTAGNPEKQSEIIAMAKSPRGNWVVHLYKMMTNAIPKEKMNRLKRAMQLMQDECSEDFVLILRAFIVLIIAFVQVNYFGALLLVLLLLFLICFAAMLFFAYQFAAIVPIISYKLGVEIEEREKDTGDSK